MSEPSFRSGGAGENSSAAERAAARFVDRYGRPPSVMVRAPGRVNLIGEHTDYNEGFVLPLALPYDTVVALEPVDHGVIEVTSEGFGDLAIDLSQPPESSSGWGSYLHGPTVMLRDDGYQIGGWRGTVTTDIPAGAGLSSSAALEVAAGLAALAADDPGRHVSTDVMRHLAAVGTRVENELLGLPSGIMDQLISATAVDGAAMFIDCASGLGRPVAIPDDAIVVVLDTGTRRQLVDSEFAARRTDCQRAAGLLEVPSLRHAQPDAVERLQAVGVDEALLRRVRHVISENRRTEETAAALADRDLDRVGRLMAESHRSLAEDYEVSGPALDAVVAAASTAPGCWGARMTGGGFAGCAVALVDQAHIEPFVDQVAERYQAPSAQPATEPLALYPVRPSSGAGLVPVPT